MCKGGAYDGLQIRGTVDELSCLRNEGTIEEVQSTGGGCASSAVAASAMGQGGVATQSAALFGLMTGALRQSRDRYRLRHKIENMFARLKDWRRVATRYDRCPILFLSACALAAIVIYW